MKVHPGKCHFLLSTKNSIDVHHEGTCIMHGLCEKLFGTTIDSDLKFDKHISGICVNAFCRVTDYFFRKT